MTGSDPACMIAILEGMGADAIGINCSLGPEQMIPVVEQYLRLANRPVLVKPNAGLPRCEGNQTFYDVTPQAFAATVAAFVQNGARLVGGCCGTTPDYIAALTASCSGMQPTMQAAQGDYVICSYHHSVILGKKPLLVGTSISAQQNPAVLTALLEDDPESIVDEAFEDLDEGANILKIDLTCDAISQEEQLAATVKELQSVINLPFWIQTDDAAALDRALRMYNGKAMVSPTRASLADASAYFDVIIKYGALLALDASTQSLQAAAKAAGIAASNLISITNQTVEYV
jgi:5-methyltetrahydrofolate--homocysteine methyltransferase